MGGGDVLAKPCDGGGFARRLFFGQTANATLISDQCSYLETVRSNNGLQVYFVRGESEFPNDTPANPQIWNKYWVNNTVGGIKAIQISTFYDVYTLVTYWYSTAKKSMRTVIVSQMSEI